MSQPSSSVFVIRNQLEVESDKTYQEITRRLADELTKLGITFDFLTEEEKKLARITFFAQETGKRIIVGEEHREHIAIDVFRKIVRITVKVSPLEDFKRWISFSELEKTGDYSFPILVYLFRHLTETLELKNKCVAVSPVTVGDLRHIAGIKQGEIQELALIGEPILIDSVMEYNAHFQPTFDLIIGNPDGLEKEPEIPIWKKWTSRKNFLYLPRLTKLNFENLKIQNRNIGDHEIIEFMKIWKNDGAGRLMRFTVCNNQTTFDAKKIYRALNALRYSALIREEFLEIEHKINNEICRIDCRQARDIYRCDGLLGTIEVNGCNITFLTWKHRS